MEFHENFYLISEETLEKMCQMYHAMRKLNDEEGVFLLILSALKNDVAKLSYRAKFSGCDD